MNVGQVCIKTAGRDAGMKCVIVDVLKNNAVMIDGQTRRRKVNVAHLEPLKDFVEIKKGAEHADVVKALKGKGIEIREKIKKVKKEKPKDVNIKNATEKPEVKKAAKAATKKIPKNK